MIAFDTNALVRILVEDDAAQAKIVENIITQVEECADQIILIPEVLVETVWVLESVYQCSRQEICDFLDTLLHTPTFLLSDSSAIRAAVSQYKRGGDFADFVIVNQAKRLQAKALVSFDRKLQKKYPGYVVDTLKDDSI